MGKPTTVQIYITSGALGRHAGVYSNDRCWAAHPSDDETAAYRAAVKFWFGKGTNAAWLYKNLIRVTVRKNTDLTWQADLAPAELTPAQVKGVQAREAHARKTPAGKRATKKKK